MADLLQIENLVIEATSYPPGEKPKAVTLVHGVSVALEKGRVLGLIGESGAGKSTIGLAAMLGEISPQRVGQTVRSTDA